MITTRMITIPMRRPHSDKQRAMITHPGSVVAFCGRRFGKTDGYVQRLFYWMQKNPGLYWWVGLSWRSASLKRAWRETTTIGRRVLSAMGEDERTHINRSSYEIRIPGLGEIWFRTADNPSSMAGEGVHGVVLDEFSLMPENVWTEYIQATLLDYGGWAAFAGVPKGQNWASALWGSSADKPGWLQIHATSYENPTIPAGAIDEIKTDPNTPEFFFRQEYLAEVISAEGQVFRFVTEAATLDPLDGPKPGAHYVCGVDVADQADFTVCTVLDASTGDMVYKDRYNRVGYPVLEDRLAAIHARWRPSPMVIEDNSIGQGVIDHLRGRGVQVQAFHTSSTTKQPLIQSLQSAFEHRAIKILNDPVLLGELVAYEAKRLASGFSYSAPAGWHDDCVMSLALAWYARGTQFSLLAW